jgi:hypothetical protein
LVAGPPGAVVVGLSCVEEAPDVVGELPWCEAVPDVVVDLPLCEVAEVVVELPPRRAARVVVVELTLPDEQAERTRAARSTTRPARRTDPTPPSAFDEHAVRPLVDAGSAC